MIRANKAPMRKVNTILGPAASMAMPIIANMTPLWQSDSHKSRSEEIHSSD